MLTIIFVLLALGSVDSLSPDVQIDFFYTSHCPHCAYVEANVLPVLKEKYNLKINSYDAGTARGYNRLTEVEDEYSVYTDGFPALLVADKMLVGDRDISVDSVIAILQRELTRPDIIGIKGSRLNSRNQDNHLTPDTYHLTPTTYHLSPTIAYFYQPGCKECDRIEYLLKNLKRNFPDAEIREFSTSERENTVLLEAMGKTYGVPENLRLITPVIFFADTFLTEKIRDKDIYQIIAHKKSWLPPWEKISRGAEEQGRVGEKNIIERFKSFSPVAVIGAGLIDGINPCAFATIIFFVSYLSIAAYKKREIFFVGIFFTLAVFIAYISIGLGLFKFVNTIKAFPIISRIVYYCIAGIAIILGGVSIYDYYLYKKGKITNMRLQLPKSIKRARLL